MPSFRYDNVTQERSRLKLTFRGRNNQNDGAGPSVNVAVKELDWRKDATGTLCLCFLLEARDVAHPTMF
jgi:hypothetical protein